MRKANEINLIAYRFGRFIRCVTPILEWLGRFNKHSV